MADFKEVIIVGAGGHARVVLDALLAQGVAVAGLIDNDPALFNTTIRGVRVLGGDDALSQHDPGRTLLAMGIGSIGSHNDRAGIVARLKAQGFAFLVVQHPRAIVAADVQLGEGAMIAAGAIIATGSAIGAFAIVNTGAIIDHDCRIGDFAHVAPGAVLSGAVTVGAGAHVGTGAAIKQGLAIGANAIVGVGAAVLHDVPAGTVVAGVPARPLAEPSG